MCGLYGTFAYKPSGQTISKDELLKCRDMMIDRGPDGAGLWISDDNRIGLAHRRLSIIDVEERANQPLKSSDERYTIIFNGEIYNYQSLRDKLIKEGVTFRTQSDTEVIIELYRKEGKAMLPKLRGMFAFAIYDTVEKKLFLARDPYGIKPLYLSDSNGVIRFCSQVKPIIGSNAVDTTIDSAGWVSFFLYGSVKEPFTTYQSIRSLPSGHYQEVYASGEISPPISYLDIKSYFQSTPKTGLSDHEREELFRIAALDSVKAHLVSDVPVGLFLSAGIDSSSLLGLMQDAGQSQIKTVTLAFEEFRGKPHDEGVLAKEIADYYGVEHSLRYISKEEFSKDIPKIFSSMDQPSIDGVNTYFASKAAAEAGLKVVISGVGGDELLGGYSSFRTIPKYRSLTQKLDTVPGFVPLLSMGADLAHSLAPSKIPAKLSGFLRHGESWAGAYSVMRGVYAINELKKILDPKFIEAGLQRLDLFTNIQNLVSNVKTDHLKVSVLESSFYMRNQLLRDSDWASMAHSVELRTPLVDKNLLANVAPISSPLDKNHPKAILAKSPSKPLPENIAKRKKTGFGIPVDDWLMQNPDFSSWRDKPHLAQESCRWARRWSYEVAQQFARDLPLA